MDNYVALALAIIKYQETVIGPLSWNEAAKVSGIKISGKNVSLSGDGKKILESLTKQYENLFGQASVEACKDAIRPLLPNMKNIELPENLL